MSHVITFFLSLFLFTNIAVSEPLLALPKVDFSFWNDKTQRSNNCYNYSTNRQTNDFAQPGQASGMQLDYNISCKNTIEAASKDLGLTLTNFFPLSSANEELLIALVVAPKYDYHWYRRGPDGFWTHKMGPNPATDKDEADQIITDPLTASRGVYTEFCGYFKVKNYIYDQTEQNGGYVRIGRMKTLPTLPEQKAPLQPEPVEESKVIIQMYSGRKNPEIPLREILKKYDLKKILQKIESDELNLETTSSKLGYNGIIIQDTEGLIAPAGQVIHLKSQSVLRDSMASALEAQLYQAVLKNQPVLK